MVTQPSICIRAPSGVDDLARVLGADDAQDADRALGFVYLGSGPLKVFNNFARDEKAEISCLMG